MTQVLSDAGADVSDGRDADRAVRHQWHVPLAGSGVHQRHVLSSADDHVPQRAAGHAGASNTSVHIVSSHIHRAVLLGLRAEPMPTRLPVHQRRLLPHGDAADQLPGHHASAFSYNDIIFINLPRASPAGSCVLLRRLQLRVPDHDHMSIGSVLRRLFVCCSPQHS